ncbi:hypothetical protein LTSEBAI_5817 [Salmonella enterica subsp. enterica serovar Baildon str. R6-199]|nr:hypothetical protein LTSEBAI_5817 [Salmonella enterica subsp. enterica serovar Baildon str. R6-199]
MIIAKRGGDSQSKSDGVKKAKRRRWADVKKAKRRRWSALGRRFVASKNENA